ncbi:MAG: hypothetical protein K2J83_01490 [Clostridia bacterium]|nr:hypothetical protein [Clostridia bacterium]
MPEIFTQDGNVFTSDLYSCILYDSYYIRFACTLTVTLDNQGRFANVVLDYGDNGTIVTEYTYGTANVIVPEH